MLKSYDNLINLAINPPGGGPKNSEEFLNLKKELCGKMQLPLPTNADLREHYEKMIAAGKIRRQPKLEKLLLSRRIRTQSGVAIVAVLTKSYPCPGRCIYCPTESGMPKSYLSNEPAVMRAISAKFNPYRQVQNRLRSLELNGHKTEKIELIVMGGTFSFLPKHYQKWFITECFRACNDYGVHKVRKVRKSIRSKGIDEILLREQHRNEKAKHRIIGVTLETRPDYIDEKEIINFRNLGSTRVELGVQSIYDPVLKANRRGHGVEATIHATKLLKDAGFKINYHIMPGLPGSSLKMDLKMFKELFRNSSFQPDMLKIYPTVVVKNSALYNLWKKGNYKALTDRQFEKFILEIKKSFIPPYVRIARLVRDVPATSIVDGPKISNIRQLIAHRSACRCIRCREVGAHYDIWEKVVLDRIDYEASKGKEIFLQYVTQDKKKLFALLRLRIPSNHNRGHFIPALRNAAIVREIHTYGKLKPINTERKHSLPASLREALQAGPQHIGLGKKLMLEAEKIAKKEFGLDKVVVISGVGVREYYKKLGYRQKDTYMVKPI
ncbi:MAG: tRNA uridine(34) 5-carboxymethylaminomethyl modification radical SAM/GNAT enzyme Elp3 [Candidatus Moranbacteria bacterium CG_4_9_14_3_um_filter_42_9]|nr:MAG: tRNA uridine(34) 5-carboxymethylaminomethyl modification radical SAM/GNAT enzyme Elp3 [Candidatus Moranbacteria bacterium CG_4_9_14_3_um_filter_42_9]